MKNFSIGDGDKQISCPDRYLSDEASPTTIVFWDPAESRISIRASVLSLTPKDPKENELAYWRAIEKARAAGVQPSVLKDKSVYQYRKALEEDKDYAQYYAEVGMGNEYCIFSITVDLSAENTEAFKTARADLNVMIESLVLRKPEEQFDCCLQEQEKVWIAKARAELVGSETGDAAWQSLDAHYANALATDDAELAGQIGFAFGELLQQEVPDFHWKVKIDEYGRSRSLDFGTTKISIFPQDMIHKRINRKESVRFAELSSGTIETVEELFRKYQDG